MRIGAIIGLQSDGEETFRLLLETGLSCCQLRCWDETQFTQETADKVNAAITKHGVTISSLWCGYPGRAVWDFNEGPLTLGVVPPEFRHVRTEVLKKGSDFARLIGVNQVITHAGFIPENPNDLLYRETLSALKDIVNRCKKNGQNLLFETGQETPVTLLRVIEDLGGENVGVNLDPANLLKYGKANPVDALDILVPYVFDVHVKDGEYPTDGKNLGVTKLPGEGRVNFSAFISKLKAAGYDGALTIERDTAGEVWKKEILGAVRLLERLI